MQKYIEMAMESHQNWLMQPDCLEQLHSFLIEKNKFFNDYEKNSTLKFCSPIQIPKNEAIHTINELTKNSSILLNPSEHEKLLEYIMKINEEIYNERERKKKFRVEQEMMNVLKKYLKNFKSSVKQTGLKEKNSGFSLCFKRINTEENKEKLKKNVVILKKDEEKSRGENEEGRFMSLAKKLRYLKIENEEKFNNIVKKCQNVKNKQLVYY